MAGRSKLSRLGFAGVLSLGAVAQGAAITVAGSNLGFSITTVVSGTPNSFPVGIAVNSDGNIMFNNYSGGTVAVIADVDNQVYSAPGTVLASAPSLGGVPGMAFANGSVWAGGGSLKKLNNNGTIAATYSNIQVNLGMWTNPVTGHILGVSGSNLIDIDVSGAVPTSTIIKAGISADGITVSPDGTKAYMSYGQIVDLIDPAHPFLTGFGSVPGADGMGVITSSNALNGAIIVNSTNSNIYMVDPITFAQTLIATGNGYGDFAGPDYTNGTLLLGSGNSILRLSCGQGCGIGSVAPPPSGVPEPSTAGLLLLALGSLGALRLRRK